MGERKVLNKYYPPDFDPAELPKRKRPKTNEMKVRMMLPMTVQCRTCGHFMYKGTKFNTKKEDVVGQDYLGIQIYRFYYRCRNCAAEFTMKTDPKTSDYLLEEGASRNYEPWREQAKEKVMSKQEREEEEMGNAMKALENRTLESKREMDIMAALDEMRSLKSRQSKVTTEQALEALQREANKQVEGGLAAEEAADLQEFYALRAHQQQQQKQSNTRLLPDTSSSGEEEDMSSHFQPRGAGAGPSSAQAGGSDVGARVTDQNGSKGTASRHGAGGSGGGTASGERVRKGAVGGAGRSLAALAMMEDGEEEELAEQEQQRERQQQQQQRQQRDGGVGGAGESGHGHGAQQQQQQQQQQGQAGAADGQQQQQQQQRQQQQQDGSGSGKDGQQGSSQRGSDLLSDALASVQGKDKGAQQQQGPSKGPVKPQIRVMAKPKAPAQQQQQQPQGESSPEGGMGGLGLLGSYGSSSSEENNS